MLFRAPIKLSDSTKMASTIESLPILTEGIDPASGEAYSPILAPSDGVLDQKSKQSGFKAAEKSSAFGGTHEQHSTPGRKKVVVVGLGMVGIAFMSVPRSLHHPMNSADCLQREADEVGCKTERI